MPQTRDTKSGRFLRTAKPWNPSTWDAGYWAQGRFRVYSPNYPRGFGDGYALRFHVVWWWYTGSAHPQGSALHHKDGDKTNDRFDNLEVVDHAAHSTHHNPTLAEYRYTCAGCGITATMAGGVANARIAEGRTPKYCTIECYHRTPRTQDHKDNIGRGLKKAYAENRR